MNRISHTYLILITLFISNPAWSQWMPFSENEKAFYTVVDKEHFSGASFGKVKILANRKILYPAQEINCHDCQDHWLGKQIEVFPNGDHIFYNQDHESIFIRSSAQLNDEWVVLERTDTKLIGKCVEVELQMILGKMDSVKTIHFYLTDLVGNILDDIVDDASFQISKNHGYLTMHPFADFPNGIYFQGVDYFLTMKFEGFADDGLGFESLKWSDVNDHEPGDELHIIEGNSYEDNNYGASSAENFYQKFSIISKDYEADEVVYQVKKDQFYQYFYRYSLTDSALSSEIIEWRFPIENEGFDRFESEPYSNGFNLGFDSPFGPAKLFGVDRYDPFWVDALTYYFNTEDKYIRGAGGPYFDGRPELDQINWRRLVYSDNRFGALGTPLDSMLFVERAIAIDTTLIDTTMIDTMMIDTMMTDTMNTIDSFFYVDNIRISPNPFEQNLTISTDSSMLLISVTLFSLSGEKVWEQNSLDISTIQIEPDLPRGVYLCHVLTSSGKTLTRKVFKL